MGHTSVMHEAEDGTAERKERIEIRQFGPHDQCDGRRRPVALLQARLGEQRSGKAMGQIIGHTSLSIPPPSRSNKTGESRIRLHPRVSTPALLAVLSGQSLGQPRISSHLTHQRKKPDRAIQDNDHGRQAPTPGGCPKACVPLYGWRSMPLTAKIMGMPA